MSSQGGEEKKVYGTFQGGAILLSNSNSNSNSNSSRLSIGYPQPVPPPALTAPAATPQYTHAYQPVPLQGYVVAEGRLVRERRLPCCGIGCGWVLFIIGFFLTAIPWYVGAIIILCARVDYREKPGYIACTIAAILATIAAILGVTKGTHAW